MELKPCPFCGGTARVVTEYRGITPVVFIKCEKCRAKTDAIYSSIYYAATEKAAEAWNRRADNG